MLVLSRKIEESVIIDGTIVVTVLGIEGDRVKLGILAPPEVTILRQEVRDRATGQPPPPRAPGRRPGRSPRGERPAQ
jgi:carbon storage regulator